MKRLALLVGVALAFLTVGTAYGQNCRPGFVHTPTYVSGPTYYQKPVVKEIIREVVQEVPIAYPVLVPAFQFQYSPPCFAPSSTYPGQFAAPYPGGYGAPTPGGYGAPTPYAMPQQPQQPQGGNLYGAPQQDKIKELAKALLDEMRRQSESEQNGDGPPVVQDPNGQPPPVPNPLQNPNPNPVQPNPNPVQNPGLNKEAARPFALNALARTCAQCHTGIGSKGEVIIFSQPGLLSPDAPLKSMLREIEAGRMPPRSSNYRLTPEELQALRIWLPAARD